MDFTDKVVLITGASSGIGAAAARRFAKAGALLSLTGRNSINLNTIARECEKIGSTLLTIVGDLTNEADVEKIIHATIEKYNKIDVLVNNAGILLSGGIEDTDLSQYDRIMNTNVRSVYHLTMLAVPHLIKTKGNMVNVSSICGLRPFANRLSYCISKAAIDHMTRCMALELGSKGVRVNAVNPGTIVTELHKRSGLDETTYQKYLRDMKILHPLQKIGQPEEVADAIYFLAGDTGSNITGITLSVDGGRHISTA